MSIRISIVAPDIVGLSSRAGPGRWCGLAALPAITLLLVVSMACGGGSGSKARVVDNSTQVGGNGFPQISKPTVLTYYYYWYDAATGSHLGPNQPLPTHPPPNPVPSWHNVSWHSRQLSDMTSAGIDIALPVYWGYGREEWSTEGLKYLVQARDELVVGRQPAPTIGMFFDTTSMAGIDLTTASGMEIFYLNIKDFYSRIPRPDWGLINGRPVVWLYVPQNGNLFEQTLFDHIYQRFNQDFGVRPFVVREAGWYCAITAWSGAGPSKRDCSHPIETDGMYHWGGAYDGYKDVGNVAQVGPGYDERKVPGRRGLVQPRDGGRWYTSNLELALGSGKRLLTLETWNEYHEATAIGETVEYGRAYIDLTRQYTSRFHATP